MSGPLAPLAHHATALGKENCVPARQIGGEHNLCEARDIQNSISLTGAVPQRIIPCIGLKRAGRSLRAIP
jgi:hypothetical protein